jgi:putative membrane protein
MLAHDGLPVAPHDVWSAWADDPFVLVAVLGVGWLYVRGLRRLWAAAGTGRGVSRAQAASFIAGLVVCLVALASPVDALGSALFSGHMLQHELLAVVAAPLLVLGEPLVAIPRGLPPRWRRRLGRMERVVTGAGRTPSTGNRLAVVFGVFLATFWIWHAPLLYDAALTSDVLHGLQHLSFLTGALWLWWSAIGRRARRNSLAGVALLFGATVQGAWGAILFVFARQPLYDSYLTTTAPWGLDPVADVRLGGIVMLAAGFAFVAGAAWLFVSWLADQERRDTDPVPVDAARRSR